MAHGAFGTENGHPSLQDDKEPARNSQTQAETQAGGDVTSAGLSAADNVSAAPPDSTTNERRPSADTASSPNHGVAGVTEEAVRDAKFSSRASATHESEYASIPADSFGAARGDEDNAERGSKNAMDTDKSEKTGDGHQEERVWSSAVVAMGVNDKGSFDGVPIVEKKKFKKLRPRDKDAYESKLTQPRNFTSANVDNFLEKTRRSSSFAIGVVSSQRKFTCVG